MARHFYAVLFGILGISLAFLTFGTYSPWLISKFAFNLGSTLFTSVLVCFSFDFYIAKYYKNKEDKFKNHGLCDMYSNRYPLYHDLPNIILKSQSSIKILGESLKTFFEYPAIQEAIETQIKNKITFDILLAHPESEAVKVRYRELGMEFERVIALHEQGLKKFLQYANNPNFTVGLFVNHPQLLLVIIDDINVYVQHYCPGFGGVEAPVFNYTGKKNEKVQLYVKIFENVKNTSTTADEVAKQLKVKTKEAFF